MKYNNQYRWKESKAKGNALMLFFSLCEKTKTTNKKISVYGLKHVYERWAEKNGDVFGEGIDYYTFSDEFIHHAQQHGFVFKQTRVSPHGDPIGYLNLSMKDIKRIIKSCV